MEAERDELVYMDCHHSVNVPMEWDAVGIRGQDGCKWLAQHTMFAQHDITLLMYYLNLEPIFIIDL